MMHFISAWYNPSRPWYSTDQMHIKNIVESHAEDTVEQLKIFSFSKEPVRVLVLKYAPNLRRFLHSQGIFNIPYWSLFDSLQGLSDDYTKPIKYLDEEWPDGVSFHYNPFLITAMNNEDLYARIFLAHDGTVTSIRYYVGGIQNLERIFDDRGFLSSVLMYESDGSENTQYYYSRSGDVLFSEHIPTGTINVIQNNGAFKRDNYNSWNQLIDEQTSVYLTGNTQPNDTVVIALSKQHNDVIYKSVTDQELVISYLKNREPWITEGLLQRSTAAFISTQAVPNIQPNLLPLWSKLPQLTVYPLTQRDDFGLSSNEHNVYISVYADNITIDELDEIIANSAEHLVHDKNTRMLVCTYRTQDLDYLRVLQNLIANYQNLDLQFMTSEDHMFALGVDLGVLSKPEESIQLKYINNDSELFPIIAKSRVLIDCGADIDYHLATEAINSGVPQINRVPQELVTHQLNGYVIEDISQVSDALDYFLNGLSHWNQSLVQCTVLHDVFRPSAVIERWNLIKAGEENEYSANRQ